MLNFLRKISGLQLWAIIIALIVAAAAADTVFKKDNTTTSINYTPTEELSQEREVAAPATEDPDVYVVREHGGIIAVFERGGSLPVLTVPVQVDFLPQDDRLLLEQGVGFDSYADMVAFLENYE